MNEEIVDEELSRQLGVVVIIDPACSPNIIYIISSPFVEDDE